MHSRLEVPSSQLKRSSTKPVGENVFGLLMSLNMLIEFGDAFDYSAAEFRAWCSEVGFRRFDVVHLAGASSAAIAFK